MLVQILSHTPLYVWAILALLVWRGIAASADREMAFGKLLIIPAVMLLLALQDIAFKFGLGAVTLAAWAGGAALAAIITWHTGTVRVSPGQQPGHVLVRGSWTHLAVMLTVFTTKYVTSVLLAMHPQAQHDTLIVVLVCTVFGLFNGILFGRLARAAASWQPGTGQIVSHR
ncbi:MAG: DUF6622 family protein [Pseudomonadota bacterium]